MKEKYRFITGSLFRYDEESNAYIHCWENKKDKTKAQAIKSYEAHCDNERIMENEKACGRGMWW